MLLGRNGVWTLIRSVLQMVNMNRNPLTLHALLKLQYRLKWANQLRMQNLRKFWSRGRRRCWSRTRGSYRSGEGKAPGAYQVRVTEAERIYRNYEASVSDRPTRKAYLSKDMYGFSLSRNWSAGSAAVQVDEGFDCGYLAVTRRKWKTEWFGFYPTALLAATKLAWLTIEARERLEVIQVSMSYDPSSS